MSKFSRRLIIFFLCVLVIGGIYAASSRFWNSGGIPKEFTDARLQGALIAQNIVNLSNQSTEDLTKINELDTRGKFADALTLTGSLIKQSQEIRDQAVELSSRVETMTRALSSIDSFDARQAALESIANRLALISRLINYSGYLGQLLDTLSSRFSGRLSKDHEVKTLIGQINAEVRAINSFNGQAGQAMDRFDRLIKQ